MAERLQDMVIVGYCSVCVWGNNAICSQQETHKQEILFSLGLNHIHINITRLF